MKPSLWFIAGLVLGFVALAGFLFAQWFAGHVSLPATLAGGAGLVLSAMALRMGAQDGWTPRHAPLVSALTLLGVALDAGQYYLYEAIPGKYYAWFLIGPFALAALLVGVLGRRR